MNFDELTSILDRLGYCGRGGVYGGAPLSMPSDASTKANVTGANFFFFCSKRVCRRSLTGCLRLYRLPPPKIRCREGHAPAPNLFRAVNLGLRDACSERC